MLDQIWSGYNEKNSEKGYIRLSVDCFPGCKRVEQECEIELGAIIQPFRNVDDIEDRVSQFGGHNILRCEECRAYVNINSRFYDNNKKWECNLCNK